MSVCADENKVYKEAGNEEDEEGEKDEDNEDWDQDVPQCLFVLMRTKCTRKQGMSALRH